MDVTNNLQNRNGTYYFRRIVPKDIRHLFPTASGKPRTEWTWSLDVKDRELAKRKLPECLARTNAMIDQARSATAAAVAEVRANPSNAQLVASQAIVDEMERVSQEAAEYFARQATEEEERAAEDPALAVALEKRALEAEELNRLRRRQDDADLLAQLRAEQRVAIMDLFDRYSAVQGRHLKTTAQWRPYIQHLVGFLGHDNALAVTERNLMEWRNHLRDNHTAKGKRLSAKTINGSYLGAVSALFGWAKNDGAIPTNPARDVGKVQVLKAARLRNKDFTLDEARLILRAALEPTTGRLGPDFRNAKRWVPWLLAYSGARVNEVTQLRKQDVVKIDGVQVVRLTPDAGPIKTRIARLVPVHSDLIAQGFLDFVASRPEGPLFYDPSKRRSNNAINRQSNRLGSKLATWVRSLGLDDTELKPNHAWRHLFKTQAVRHDLHQQATMAIMGHSGRNEHDKYGSTPVDVLAANMEKLPPFLSGS